MTPEVRKLLDETAKMTAEHRERSDRHEKEMARLDRIHNAVLIALCVLMVVMFGLRIFTLVVWGFDPLTETRP